MTLLIPGLTAEKFNMSLSQVRTIAALHNLNILLMICLYAFLIVNIWKIFLSQGGKFKTLLFSFFYLFLFISLSLGLPSFIFYFVMDDHPIVYLLSQLNEVAKICIGLVQT